MTVELPKGEETNMVPTSVASAMTTVEDEETSKVASKETQRISKLQSDTKVETSKDE
jgi:hypothetical protein